MTMNDLLRMLLAAADDIDRSFDHAATATWPPGSLDALQKLGILRRSAGGMYASCPNCNEGHTEPVTVLAGRFYISCPEALLVEVAPEMCECWEIDPNGLAKAVATSMGLVGRPQPVVPARFWRLRRTSWPPGSPKARPVVFARRMQDDDATAIAAHVGAGGRAIVLVPHHRPDTCVWPGSVPAVISLAEVMTWDDGLPVLDVMAMVDAVETADHLAEASEAVALGPTGKKMVRRQVKAEMKGQLEDDVLVAAWKTFGSIRKAAEALTKQLGRPITKDKVQGAITRAGGAKALRQEMDSASVARTVASQRRDRGKKISQYRN
jgi:hypothetical protein